MLFLFFKSPQEELEQCEARLKQLAREEQELSVLEARTESRLVWSHRLAFAVDGAVVRRIGEPEAIAGLAEHELHSDAVFLPLPRDLLLPPNAANAPNAESPNEADAESLLDLLPLAREVSGLATPQELRGVLVLDYRILSGLQSGATTWSRNGKGVMFPRPFRTGPDAGRFAPGKVGFRPETGVEQGIELAWDVLAVVTKQAHLAQIRRRLESLLASVNRVTHLIESEQDNKLLTDLEQLGATLRRDEPPSESELRSRFEALSLDSKNLLSRPEILDDSALVERLLASIDARVICAGLEYRYDAGFAEAQLDAARGDFSVFCQRRRAHLALERERLEERCRQLRR